MLLTRSNDKILTLDEVKLFLRVIGDDENAFLENLAFDAVQFVERVSGMAVMEVTVINYYDDIEDFLLITDYSNAKEITLVEYRNTANVWTVMSSDLYELAPDEFPAKVYFRRSRTNFPLVTTDLNAVKKVRITYKAGPTGSQEKSSTHRRACLMYCGYFYENRQAQDAPKYLYEMIQGDSQKYAL